MASDLTHISLSQNQAAIELEFLQAVLSDDTYPWLNAQDPSNTAYFDTLEEDWQSHASEEENSAIAAQEAQFFQRLEQVWANVDAATTQPSASSSDALATIQSTLIEQFQERIPVEMIRSLTHTVHRAASQPLSLADQLVQSVQNILPEWGTEDLQVLARPYAFAMRGPESDKLEVALRSVRYAAWTELSGVEQARLSLAIARYTLSQMPSDTPQ